MSMINLALVVLVVAAASYYLCQQAILTARSRGTLKLHSLPHYYGWWGASMAAVPALLVLLVMGTLDDVLFKNWLIEFYPPEIGDNAVDQAIAFAKVMNLAQGILFGTPEAWIQTAADAYVRWLETSRNVIAVVVIGLSLGGGALAYSKVTPDFRSRNAVERVMLWALAISSTVAILTTIGIVLSVAFESIRFFRLVPFDEFVLGLTWNPQFEGAERAGSGQMGLATYGMVPLFVGTFLISAVALIVAVPVGLFSAIYLAEYAGPKTRGIVKPLLEILAGVPTVVYGFFAALTVAPVVKSVGESMGLTVASESALAAGLVMGVMIIPFISSLADDVINAVPQALRDAAYGLGSTHSEAVRQVVLPAALPGIVAAIILAVSRAIGETMIVVMAAGLAANLSFNPLDAVTTVTAQIVTILVGDQEFESAKTLAAFALALLLIIITLGLNFFALQIVKKYREQYD